MMDWTDRHDRVFLRQFSSHALLYTEMVTSAALEHGDANYLLKHDSSEHPVALQLGGSNPDELARAAALGDQAGFDEINLNVGCPSDRVQSGAQNHAFADSLYGRSPGASGSLGQCHAADALAHAGNRRRR